MKNVIIKADKLCKTYIVGKTGNNILKNIDLEIYEGDFTVIMGASGSGKSTLLYALSAMDRKYEGNISLLNLNTSSLKEVELSFMRSHDISFIFQSINLLTDLNILENVSYNAFKTYNKKDAINISKNLLKRFGLEESLTKYPSEISGGMAQRVAIARSLVTNPKIIFADEPTGALNSKSGADVLDYLNEINEVDKKSIIMVTHDIKAASRANRLIYLEDGRIVGDLNIGRYTLEEALQRENMIFEFLKSHRW